MAMGIDVKDLNSIKEARKQNLAYPHSIVNEVRSVIDGQIPGRYMEMFPEDIPVAVPNMMRVAKDDMVNLAAKVFSLNVLPRNNTAKAKQEAERAEMIGYGYNNAGRVPMSALMHIWCDGVIAGADSVGIVVPDKERKTPIFHWRDTVTHFPPIGWTPWSQAPLDNTMFVRKHRLEEIYQLFPDKRDEVRRKYTSTTHMGKTTVADPNKEIEVTEFYSTESWIIAILDDKPLILKRSDQGDKDFPGVCPVATFTLFSPHNPKGRSIFADQIPLQMYMARFLSQQAEYFDQLLYATLIGPPLVGNLQIGPRAYNIKDPTSPNQSVDVIQPTNPVQADQLMGFVMGLSRILNRNPEFMQGVGEANSAKAISELRAGINSTIRDGIWPAIISGLNDMYSIAAQIDCNLWPNEKKRATGSRKGTTFMTDYVPSVHLEPYKHSIKAEPGLGLGGYQGTVELLQLLQAGTISMDTFREQHPYITNSQEEARRVESQEMSEVMMADLLAKAQAGGLQPDAFSEIKKLIDEKGMDRTDAVAELAKAGKLFVAPQGPEAVPGGAPEGIPPELAALMGGAPPGEAGPPPNLRQIRGAA